MRSFKQSPGFVYYVNEIERQAEPFGEWELACDFSFNRVDWAAFLDGCGEHPTLLEFNAEAISAYRPRFPLAALIHAVSMFHKVGSHRQALPLQVEVVSHLEKMKLAASRLADLAQGGSGREAPSQTPEWAQDTDVVNTESDGSFETGRRRADLAVHPVLHELLVQALDGSDPDNFGAANRKHWNLVADLFENIRRLSNVLDVAAHLARDADRGEKTPAHRSTKQARRWARTSLLWIWRDVIGREIRLSLKDPSEHTTVDAPEPNDCVRFVIDALAHVDPVKPHYYPALERDLRRASEEIPASNLLLPVK